jgi:translation initiation factor 1 (eIF-1/SUI1)
MRRALAAPALALTALAVVLAGCGGEPQPRTLPKAATTSTTPASSASSSPTSPGTPSTATPTPSATSKAAVKKQLTTAVRRYFTVVNGFKTNMDANRLAALFTNNCSCQEQVDSVRKTAKQGNRYTQQATITELTPVLVDDHHGLALVTFNTSAGGAINAHGRLLHRAKARTGVTNQFHLILRQGRWLISQIDAVE